MHYFGPDFWDKKRQLIALGVLGFLFAAAVVQYALGFTYVLSLTSALLAAMTAMTLIVWDAPLRQKVSILAGVFCFGFIVELIGVHTGLLFGHYTYTNVLGFRVFGVPIMIGLVWFIVTMAAWHIVLLGALSRLQRFLMAVAIVVMFDLILEQFAAGYSLWTWRGGVIPLFNYLCWAVIAAGLFAFYKYAAPKTKPSIYIAGQLPLMALFFWLMLLVK